MTMAIRLDLKHGDTMHLPMQSRLKVMGLAAAAAAPALGLLTSRLGPFQPIQMRAPGPGEFVTFWERPSSLEAAIIMVLGAGNVCSPEIISRALRDTRSRGGLGICVATKPFAFEGRKRKKKAQENLDMILKAADLLLVVDHEAFLAREGDMTVREAFSLSNDAVLLAVQATSELISSRSTFYVTAANSTNRKTSRKEVLRLLHSSGKASIGFGRDFSAGDAVKRACVSSPFLQHASSMNSKGLVICALASRSLQAENQEQEAAEALRSMIHPDSKCICFSFQDNSLEPGVVQATVIVTRPQERQIQSYKGTKSSDHIENEPGPNSDFAKAWARARATTVNEVPTLPLGVRKSSTDDHNSVTLPHDPEAVPGGGILSMGMDAVYNMASIVMKRKDQPSLAQRVASMLEHDRSQKGLTPTVEIHFKNGNFKGRCEDGLPDGQGRCTYADGSFYDGLWKQGKREGSGSFYYANGDVFQGAWHQNVKHGTGWLYFHSGDRLHAEFVNGKVHGEGRYYSADGSLFFGTFRENWRHGQCIFVDAGGTKWLETYNDGLIVSRTMTRPCS